MILITYVHCAIAHVRHAQLLGMAVPHVHTLARLSTLSPRYVNVLPIRYLILPQLLLPVLHAIPNALLVPSLPPIAHPAILPPDIDTYHLIYAYV